MPFIDLDQGTKRVQKLLMRDIKWPCFVLFIRLSCHTILRCNYFYLNFA